MTDLQAEINAKEKCQEQLNKIYQNAIILNGDTSKYQQAYLDQLKQEIDDGWSKVGEISVSMLAYKNIASPKALTTLQMTSAGIIPEVQEIVQSGPEKVSLG